MKKVLGKVGIIFTIILLALITFTNAQEDNGLNYIEEGNIIKLTEEQEQEIQRQKEQKFEENESQKLDEKDTENIALAQNVGISTIANSADYKVTQLDLKEWNLENFTIDSDTTSIYFCNEYGVQKYSAITKKMETVVNFENPQQSNLYYYCVQGNIFYILVNGTTTSQTYHVQGYDLIQKKKVVDKKFNVNAQDFVGGYFAVDSNQNFYLQTGKGTITSFDKNGNKLDSATSPVNDQLHIIQLTPDGKTLITELYVPSQKKYQRGYLAVENGKFLRYYGEKITTSPENIPFFVGTNFSYDLKFNKECTFAFDSLGHIFKYKFEYQDGFRTTWFSYVEDANTSYYYSIDEPRMLL